MNTRFLSRLAALSLFALLASCTNQKDIDTLTMRVNKNENQIQALSSKVGSVEQVLPGQAEMWAQMQDMRQQLNQLRGQVDDMSSKSGGSSPEVARLNAATQRLEVAMRQMASELGVSVEALNAPLETGQYNNIDSTSRPEGMPSTSSTISASPGGAPAATPGTTSPAVTAPPQAQSTDTATALYDSGMKAFSDRNYKGAIKAFSDFTQSFPNHKLASNAHFWQGESQFQLKNYGAAALAYQQVLEKFPGSAKYQSAMLKQGMAFHEAGKKDAAKLRLEELIKRYPSSPEATRAKKFLQTNK